MPGTAVVERAAPQRYMQGIAVPAEAVQPAEFFARTRRKIQLEKQFAYAGQSTDIIELRKSDILATIKVIFSGTLVVTGGTAKTSARWPYDLLTAKFTANGQSNIVNVSGLKLKIRDIMKKSDLTDRGVVQTIGGVARTQGTLAQSSESWGVGSQTTAIPAGTYDVQLEWDIPVSEDEADLAGAIYLQTSTSDLTLQLDWLPLTQLVAALTATNVSLTGNIQVISTKFGIPIGGNGQIVVPDLSVFHSLIQTRTAGAIATGENELRVIGQGAGKSLLRAYYQVYNGAGFDAAPLPMNRTNFGKQSWRYSNNETPDEFIDGSHMRLDMERRYNADHSLWGVGCHDFVHENAFRDVVDMGTTAELRLVSTIQQAVVLTQPALELVTETVFLAGQA